MYQYLYDANDDTKGNFVITDKHDACNLGGSFYLRSKVHNAWEVVIVSYVSLFLICGFSI